MKKYIVLSRVDLIDSKKELPIGEITLNDFKKSSVTREEIRNAELINFIDGGNVGTLKERGPESRKLAHENILGTPILKILETVFLPEWSNEANICSNGEIYVRLLTDRFFTKDQAVEFFKKAGYNSEYIDSRVSLFQKLETYYAFRYQFT